MIRLGLVILGLVGVGGLGVDGLVLIATGNGDWARIRVSASICAVAAYMIGFGYILDEAARQKFAKRSGQEGSR